MKSPACLTGYLAILFLLPALAPAEDLFVRPVHTTGTNSGADWANAWNGFASIVWGDGPGRLGAGDTLWLAGGTYTYPLAFGASGVAGAPITIQRVRATDAAATNAAGWNSALEAQVVITAPVGIYADGGRGSHTIVDGRTPSGIRINYGDDASGIEFDSALDMTDITLRYIEAAGPGPIVQSGNTRGFDLTITGELRNLTISHCEIHHSDTLLQISRSVNLVIEHSSFHHSGALNAATYHPNAIYLATVQNATIRYNRFHDNSVEGLFFGDPFNNGAKIHGNLFYQGASPRDTGRGIEFDDRADSRDFLVFNNTFVDLPLPGVNFANGQPHPGALVQNNLFSGCGVLFGPAMHDYNYVSAADAAEPHGVVGSGVPPFANPAAFDYRIVGQLAPTLPRNRGTPLATEFALDANGVTRGADGAWDIGAFEFVNTRPTITGPGDFTTLGQQTAGPLTITVGDGETPLDQLTLSLTSSNSQLIAAGSASFGGSGASRTVSLPIAGASGQATITVNVDDGMGGTAAASFVVTALPNSIVAQTVTVGLDVSFSAPVGASGIQWQISTDGGINFTHLTDGARVTGATSRTLTLLDVTAELHNARYRFLLPSIAGSAVSNAATLTVAPVFFPFPSGLVVESSGDLIVCDAANNSIKRVNAARQVTLLAGTDGQSGAADGTTTTARFNQPSGIVAAPGGGWFVADTANATLRRVTATGSVTTFAGAPTVRGSADGQGATATFNSLVGLALDGVGVLLVADAMNHLVRRVFSDASVQTYAGSAGLTGSVDGAGAAARFNFPTGIASDAAGNCYVTDTTNNTIRRITNDGIVSTLAGLPGVTGNTDGTGATALFNRPSGLAIARDGTLYVTDTGNSTLRKVSSGGVVTTLAGLSGIAGLKDGMGSDAFFNQPTALALDGDGNIFVADTGNAAIRRVTPAGEVTTLALSAGTVAEPVTPTTPPATPPTIPSPVVPAGSGGGGAPSLLFVLFVAAALLRARKK